MYRTCKNLLVKLRRDQQTALANRRYDITSCPICMEDFEGDAKPVDAAAVQADIKPIGTSGALKSAANRLAVQRLYHHCCPSVPRCTDGNWLISGYADDLSTDSLQDGAPLLPPTNDGVTVTERKAERTASGSNAPNQPLVLPCGHCFCDACIAK